MKKIDIYILREHIPPFFGGVAILTMVLLLDRVFDLLDLFLKKGVDISTVFEVFYLSMPFILAMTVPMAVLVATLIAYGRLAQDFEVMAWKASGISLPRSLLGPLIGGVLLSISMIIFDSTVLPQANHKLKGLLIDIYEKKPVTQIKEGVFSQIENFLVFVERKDERSSMIYGVKINEVLSDGTVRNIIARKGKISYEPGYIVLYLEDGELHETIGEKKEGYRKIKFYTHTVKIPFNSELIRKERKTRSDREMTLPMLLQDIKRIKGNMIKTDKKTTRYNLLKRQIYRNLVEVHKKFAIPMAAIVFIILGAPIACITKKGGYGTALGISVIVFTVYYILLVGGEELADKVIIPPVIGIWTPDVILFIVGLYLLRRNMYAR